MFNRLLTHLEHLMMGTDGEDEDGDELHIGVKVCIIVFICFIVGVAIYG